MQDLRLVYEWGLVFAPLVRSSRGAEEGWQHSAEPIDDCLQAPAECEKAFAKTNGAGVRIVIAGLPAPP